MDEAEGAIRFASNDRAREAIAEVGELFARWITDKKRPAKEEWWGRCAAAAAHDGFAARTAAYAHSALPAVEAFVAAHPDSEKQAVIERIIEKLTEINAVSAKTSRIALL